MHARMAAQASDEETRARHLAFSSDASDGAVAAELEAASGRASARDDFDLAAEFAAHAARVTPADDTDALVRRRLAEVEARIGAGQSARALALADELAASCREVRREPGCSSAARTPKTRTARRPSDACSRPSRTQPTTRRSGGRCWSGWSMPVCERTRSPWRGWRRPWRSPAGAAIVVFGSGSARCSPGHMRWRGRRDPRSEQRRSGSTRKVTGSLATDPRNLHAKELVWAGELAAARVLLDTVWAEVGGVGSELQRMQALYDRSLLETACGAFDEASRLVDRGREMAVDSEEIDWHRQVRRRRRGGRGVAGRRGSSPPRHRATAGRTGAQEPGHAHPDALDAGPPRALARRAPCRARGPRLRSSCSRRRGCAIRGSSRCSRTRSRQRQAAATPRAHGSCWDSWTNAPRASTPRGRARSARDHVPPCCSRMGSRRTH